MMKPLLLWMLSAVAVVFTNVETKASELSLDVCANTGLIYRINGRMATQGHLESLFGKLVDSNMVIYVFFDSDVQPAQFVQTISTIQDFGFHQILLVCEGSKDGTNGTFFVTIDCFKYSVGARCGYGGNDWKSGFYPENNGVHPLVHAWHERRKRLVGSRPRQATNEVTQ